MTRHDVAQRNEQQIPTSRHGNLQYTVVFSVFHDHQLSVNSRQLS